MARPYDTTSCDAFSAVLRGNPLVVVYFIDAEDEEDGGGTMAALEAAAEDDDIGSHVLFLVVRSETSGLLWSEQGVGTQSCLRVYDHGRVTEHITWPSGPALRSTLEHLKNNPGQYD